jgi:hypothetical protein
MSTHFRKLNEGWNADPNAPDPSVRVTGSRVVLEFTLNAFVFPQFKKEQRGQLVFSEASRYRLGPTNDEGWAMGQCRFGHLAEWGEFYEVSGDLLLDQVPGGWNFTSTQDPAARHFLFYLRDETFECDAERWEFRSSIDDRDRPRTTRAVPERH